MIAGIGVVLAVFVNTVRPTVVSIVLWTYIYIYLGAKDLRSSNRHPRWIEVARDLLIMQGDIQLVTDLSIVVACLINIYRDDETPLCHMFIARAFADMSLEGHAAAIIPVYLAKHDWKLRTIIFSVINMLWEWWSLFAIYRIDRWIRGTPHCLENDSIIPGDYKGWIIYSLIWFPVGFITLYMTLSAPGSAFMDPFAGCGPVAKNLAQNFRAIFRNARGGSTQASIGLWMRIAFNLVLTLLCLIFWAFALLILVSR